jgi:hypothetical protein
MPSLADVFGLNKANNPASYVVRDVETKFLAALKDTAVNAIVIYGMSKQGKSSLLRHALQGKDCIITDGNRGLSLEDLFHDLLHRAGFEYQQSEVNGEIRLSWFWGGLGLGGRDKRTPLPIRINNPASVATYLAEFRKKPIIVVDQFHTLDVDVQRQFASAIATFAGQGCKIIVIGTWTDSGYLIKYNTNLIGNVREFSFEEWTPADLHAVLNTGLPLLNLGELSEGVRRSLVARSAGNVALLQELTKFCLLPFEEEGKIEKAVGKLDVARVGAASGELLERVYHHVLQALRPITEIGQNNPFAAGKSRSWWILNAFLDHPRDDVKEGVDIDALLEHTNKLAGTAASRNGRRGSSLPKSEMVGLLKRTWHGEQTKHGLTPILAYHDVKEALVIVDAWTKFVLRTRDTRQRLRAEL